MNAFVIDAFEFSRINGSREGVTPVAEMTRLTKDCADNSGTIAWQVVGGTGKMGFPELTLSVSGTVQLVCQRCLTPFAHHIDASSLPSISRVEASIWCANGVRQRWHTSWTVPDTDRVNSGNPILPMPPTTCQAMVPELSAQSFVNRVISATGVTPSRLPLMRLNSKASITKAFIGRNFPRKTCDNNRVFRTKSKA